jgi:hypothetical protein
MTCRETLPRRGDAPSAEFTRESMDELERVGVRPHARNKQRGTR